MGRYEGRLAHWHTRPRHSPGFEKNVRPARGGPCRRRKNALSLEELRRRALEAATSKAPTTSKDARRTYRQRSDAVRDYVLARAQGHCEVVPENWTAG